MKCTLVLSLAKDVKNLDGDLIGVDRGAYILALNHKKMVLAIGDFDSVDENEYQQIFDYSDTITKLNPVKDDTDTLAAIKTVIAQGYDEILIYGGLTKRLDHTYANILLLQQFKEITCLQDEQTLVKILKKGRHIITKRYQYISFFAINDSLLSLTNLKYNLKEYQLSRLSTLGISNEFTALNPVVDITAGEVMMILTNEK